MTVESFDAVTRGAAATVSRRGSLLAAGGAGLTALTAQPVVEAAKNNIKKRAKKKGKKKCKRQVDQCRSYWEEYCTLTRECDEEVLEEALLCCEHLGGCQTDDFFACLIEAFTPEVPM